MNAAPTTNGGCARDGAPSPTTPATAGSIVAQIAALQKMSVGDLRARYAEVYGEETNSRNKVWLFRQIAWQIQALAEGGLSERAKRRAAELARESDVRPRRRLADDAIPTLPTGTGPTRIVTVGPVRDPKAPLPGTVLCRDYKGQNVVVRVLDDGFEWNGRVFGSLSAVAKAVTGSHWSGALFFGLRKARTA